MSATKIYIVTPSFNAADTIDRTISSVLSQAGEFELHFHVQDGASTDDTEEKLHKWDALVREGRLPVNCEAVAFSFSIEADRGMYDAIVRGFSTFDMPEDAWMSWINADDILAPGACALMSLIDGDKARESISWVAGTAAIMSKGSIVGQTERYLTSQIIGAGLCDGTHWEFVQQEGTFFRRWLWNTVAPRDEFSAFRLAGDWNLWRLFAHHADIYQVGYPLGYFSERPGQLSVAQRDQYIEEIDGIIDPAERTRRLVQLLKEDIAQKRLSVDYKTRSLKVRERDLQNHLAYRLNERFGEPQANAIRSGNLTGLELPDPKDARELDEEVDQYLPPAEDAGPPSADQPPAELRTEIIAHDADWQFPAITERHAFEKAREFLPFVPDVCYLAFPWATLIDHLNRDSDGVEELLENLQALRVPDAGYKRVVTVCQHIHMERYTDIFAEAGVTDVFWSHADTDKDEMVSSDGWRIRLHPFPLFPVQAVPIDRQEINGKRSKLFSFVGAKSNQWYLTQSRTWLLEQLGNDPRGVVRGRDSWHYQKVVYDHQIEKSAAEEASLVDEDASKFFRDLLLDSKFSLCPSGSGPNSIRLWESIGAGAIPVVLADTYRVPGDIELWKNAVVFCEESPTAIAELPNRLEALAADEQAIASMRAHLDQLWMLYGPEIFVSDIQQLYMDIAAEAHRTKRAEPALVTIAKSIIRGDLNDPAALRSFLKLCAARLELSGADLKKDIGLGEELRLACDYALAKSRDASLNQRIHAAWSRSGLPALLEDGALAVKTAKIQKHRVFLFGRHSNRTPMGYEPYKKLFQDQVDYVSDLWKADTLVTGFDIDFLSATDELMPKFKVRPEMHALVVSEEPLWDTVWAKALESRSAAAKGKGGGFSYSVINHVNSDVFKFERLPYFITTDDKFFQRYGLLFHRNSQLTADELLDFWQSAQIRSAFYAEKRIDERYDVAFPEIGVRGLCAYRSRVAEKASSGHVVRIGQGWSEALTKRQSLADWHLDKLAALHRKALIVSGLENTHQADYITEKPFDAFAVLGVPLYYASPAHRIHELCPNGGFLNLYDMTEEEAARAVDAFEPDRAFAEAYLDTQKRLAALFSDPETLNRERSRVTNAVLSVL